MRGDELDEPAPVAAKAARPALRPVPGRDNLLAPESLAVLEGLAEDDRSEEHTSELQSLMRNSYAVFCLKKKNLIHLYRLLIVEFNIPALAHLMPRDKRLR